MSERKLLLQARDDVGMLRAVRSEVKDIEYRLLPLTNRQIIGKRRVADEDERYVRIESVGFMSVLKRAESLSEGRNLTQYVAISTKDADLH
jgi:hypothetical protein